MHRGKYILFIIGFLAICFVVLFPDSAQTQSTWAHAYGGSNEERVDSIIQTADGGFLVAGYIDLDIWIIKLDFSGNITWQKRYGGSSSEYVYSVLQTVDGGYIVAGSTSSFGAGNYDFWVLKLDSAGNVLWQKTYGGSSDDYAGFIKQTSSGGYILAGNSDSFNGGPWIIKLDPEGNITGQNMYYGSYDDSISVSSVQQTIDGGLILTGSKCTGSPVCFSVLWILKLDSYLNPVWNKTYGSDFGRSIQQTIDGGYIVAGAAGFYLGPPYQDFWILKLDTTGNIIWQKTYGGANSDVADSIQQTSDGSYIVAGNTGSYGSGYIDIWILKIDPDGTMDSSCTFINDTMRNPVISSISHNSFSAIISSPSIVTTETSITGIDAMIADTLICSSCPAPVGISNNSASDLEDCSDTGIQINWGIDPADWGDGGSGTRSYTILRNGNSLISGLSYGSTTFIDISGTHGQTYLYQVRYVNGCGSALATAGIQAVDYPYPPTLMATIAMDNSPLLDSGVAISWPLPDNWGDNGANASNRSFRVYRNSTDISGLLPSDSLSYEDTSGINNMPYAYHTEVINGCGIFTAYGAMVAMDSVQAPGAVPDNDNYPGTPLTIMKSGTSNLILNWAQPAGTCLTADYAIYRGTLPWTGYNHASVSCSTGGATSLTILSEIDSYYFLVTAQYGGGEGSYGLKSDNTQRPAASSPCFPLQIGTCN